eukprot:4960574-Prymnesium_polylepis.1
MLKPIVAAQRGRQRSGDPLQPPPEVCAAVEKGMRGRRTDNLRVLHPAILEPADDGRLARAIEADHDHPALLPPEKAAAYDAPHS